MRLTEISYGSAQPVEGYGPGFFRVGGHVLRGACLITPWDAGPWGGAGRYGHAFGHGGADRCAALGHGGRDRPSAARLS